MTAQWRYNTQSLFCFCLRIRLAAGLHSAAGRCRTACPCGPPSLLNSHATPNRFVLKMLWRTEKKKIHVWTQRGKFIWVVLLVLLLILTLRLTLKSSSGLCVCVCERERRFRRMTAGSSVVLLLHHSLCIFVLVTVVAEHPLALGAKEVLGLVLPRATRRW